MEASGVALKLRSEQATRAFFVDLAGLLSAVAHACASSGAWPDPSHLRQLQHPALHSHPASHDFHAMYRRTLSLCIQLCHLGGSANRALQAVAGT
jgi:hypothetical protein